jgi:hypothetical protein
MSNYPDVLIYYLKRAKIKWVLQALLIIGWRTVPKSFQISIKIFKCPNLLLLGLPKRANPEL